MVQFRRRKSFGPLRFTLSQRGLGVSVGVDGFRVGRGADGKVRRTLRIPGTGVYDTKVIGGAPPHSRTSDQPSHPLDVDAAAVRLPGEFALTLTVTPFGSGVQVLDVHTGRVVTQADGIEEAAALRYAAQIIAGELAVRGQRS